MFHFKKVCRECETVVAQCRCAALKKGITYVDATECPRCNVNKTCGLQDGREEFHKMPLEELAIKCSGADHVWKGSAEVDGRYMNPKEPKADQSCACGDYIFADVQMGKVAGTVVYSVEPTPLPTKQQPREDHGLDLPPTVGDVFVERVERVLSQRVTSNEDAINGMVEQFFAELLRRDIQSFKDAESVVADFVTTAYVQGYKRAVETMVNTIEVDAAEHE